MANILKVTELDFDTIKANMKAYFTRQNSPFRDWDFEGSGLNYLLDILAYNTHYNAVNAHLSMNESFLDSAQIRSNVVSRAKLLGYTPRSRRGARAKVNISFSRKTGYETVETLTLPRGTTFSTSIDGTSFTFTTREDYEAIHNTATNLFEYEGVVLVQGKLTTRTYIVDSNFTRYPIEDTDIDTSTLEVTVRPHSQTSESALYLNADLFTSYDPDSQVYFLSENYDGEYVLEFGDGVIGKQLDNLSVITAEYLKSGGVLANGAHNFSFVQTPAGSDIRMVATLSSLTLTEASYGGDERESIEEVRRIAPYAFIAQNRAVTSNDYEALIKKSIPDIEAISVWGGQDNDPPVYGKVFLAAKPKGAFYLTTAQKEEILNYLDRVRIITVQPEVVDPSYLFLSFDVFVKFNPNMTTLTATQLESQARASVIAFNTTNLGGFDNVFRYSKFLAAIDATDTSILNSFARIYVHKDLNLYATRSLPQELDFKMAFYGKIDQAESFITSTAWRYNNVTVYLGDEYKANTEVDRNLYVYSLNPSGSRKKIFPSIGTLNVTTGKLLLQHVPSTFDTSIRIKAIPNAYDIATIRNQLISIDAAATSITADIDDTFNTGAADRTYDTIPRFRN